MPYKPMSQQFFRKYIEMVGWSLEKGGIDWNLYDENKVFICSIKIAHGKNTKEEVVANSVHKTEKFFKEKGLSWPPKKKKK
jgi:hypothetical protein